METKNKKNIGSLLLNFKRAYVLSLVLISTIFSSVGFAYQILVDVKEGGEVAVSNENHVLEVKSHGSGFIMSSGLLSTNVQTKKTCKNVNVLSVRDAKNDLLGTATKISDGVLITARHVFAGKDFVSIKSQNNSVNLISEKFKKYFQIINKQTGKPIDVLLISETDTIAEKIISDLMSSQVHGENIRSGEKWSSCQYGLHENKQVFSQFSEGELQLISEDDANLYLGVSKFNESNGEKFTDLTTFGSSGASIWLGRSEQSPLIGVVSCLQRFRDNHSGRDMFFPKIISLFKIFTSGEYQLKETTPDELRMNPQESDRYCPFTDGKGAGGLLTQDEIDARSRFLRTDSGDFTDQIQMKQTQARPSAISRKTNGQFTERYKIQNIKTDYEK